MAYQGDFNPGATVHFTWSTNSGAGASITPSTPGTVSVYKNLGTTQSVAGVTDTRTFDALTGIQACAIDTSADGTFYSAGADFDVVLSAATIDGQSVNAVLAQFSIENRNIKANVTQYGGTNGTFSGGRPEVNTTHWAGTAVATAVILAAANIASNAFTAAKFAANALDAVWSTAARLLTAGTNIVLAKGTGVTGFNDLDASGVRGAVGLASANLDTQLSGINTKTTNLPADPASSSTITTAISALNNVSTAQVKTQVVAALNTDTYAEPAAVPAATATLVAKIGWLTALGRNKLTQTATTQTLRNDADAGSIGTSTDSDDLTTAVRGKWS